MSSGAFTAALLFKKTVAYDKGKPAARQGRKAKSLSSGIFESGGEIVWLPKGNWKESGLQVFQRSGALGFSFQRIAAKYLFSPGSFFEVRTGIIHARLRPLF